MVDPSWPPFLDLLDSDPDNALVGFYRFLTWTVQKVPPRPMTGLSDEDRKDVIHDIFLHCTQHDFRVLRQYSRSGHPFAAWLHAVARNACTDSIRKRRLRREVVCSHQESEARAVDGELRGADPNPGEQIERAELLVIVKKAINELGEYCRFLLEMAADGLTISEMVSLLGLAKDQNKRVSDDLRYCRKKIKRRLEANGIDLASIFT